MVRRGSVFMIALSMLCASAAALDAPFPGAPVEKEAPPLKEPPVCDSVPAPLVRLDTVSKYDQSDPTRSKINPAGEKQFRKDIRPLEVMTEKSVRYANRYWLSGGKKRGAASCALVWLHGWAKEGALRELTDDKAYNTVGKYLGGMALAYLQIKNAPGLDERQKHTVEQWLASVAVDLAGYHARTPHANASRNNHLYWSGLGIAATGVASDRLDLFDWGMEAARRGLRDIEADGTLPLELARRSRARDYHMYALTPLVMLAELGYANGVDLYAEHEGALRRLAALVLRTVDDPAFFERKTGVKQIPYPDKDTRASRLAWLEPYHARFPDARTEALLKGIRPVTSKFLGGKLSEIYALHAQ